MRQGVPGEETGNRLEDKMACNHKFQGHKDGVMCLLCGLRMTPKEYAEYLKQAGKPQKASKNPGTSKKKKEVVVNE